VKEYGNLKTVYQHFHRAGYTAKINKSVKHSSKEEAANTIHSAVSTKAEKDLGDTKDVES
jgi:hypothetical protein